MSEHHLSSLIHSFVMTVIVIVFGWIGLAGFTWVNKDSLSELPVKTVKTEQFSTRLLIPIMALAKAKRVESKHIGVTATLSKNYQAFDEIMANEHAELAFEYLLAVDNVVVKAYAMQGFADLHSIRFSELKTYFKHSNNQILLQSGCLIYQKPINNMFQ